MFLPIIIISFYYYYYNFLFNTFTVLMFSDFYLLKQTPASLIKPDLFFLFYVTQDKKPIKIKTQRFTRLFLTNTSTYLHVCDGQVITDYYVGRY